MEELGYFMNAREDVVAELSRPLGHVLDVGCGAGNVGPGLRRAGADRLTGVEFFPAAAEAARERFDTVHEGRIEDVLTQLEGPFDTILCLDVLEHLGNPEPVLRDLRELASPGGQLKVSVPNARQISLVYDLVVRGTFGYTDWGHRDRTHLRWFTRRDIEQLVRDTGWRITGVSHPPLGRSRRLDRVTAGRSTEFLVGQWYIAAAAS